MNFEKQHIKDGYSTHKDYFDELEASVLEELDLQPKLQEEQADGYAADDAYFDNLEDQVFAKLNAQHNVHQLIPNKDTDSNSNNNNTNSNKLWYATSFAAACIVIILLFTFKSNNTEPDFATLSPEVENYYLQQQDLFLSDADLQYILDEDIYDIDIEDQELDKDLTDYLLEEDLILLEALQE